MLKQPRSVESLRDRSYSSRLCNRMFSPESDRPVVLQASRALEKNGEGRRGFCKIAVMFVFATAAALVCAQLLVDYGNGGGNTWGAGLDGKVLLQKSSMLENIEKNVRREEQHDMHMEVRRLSQAKDLVKEISLMKTDMSISSKAVLASGGSNAGKSILLAVAAKASVPSRLSRVDKYIFKQMSAELSIISKISAVVPPVTNLDVATGMTPLE